MSYHARLELIKVIEYYVGYTQTVLLIPKLNGIKTYIRNFAEDSPQNGREYLLIIYQMRN